MAKEEIKIRDFRNAVATRKLNSPRSRLGDDGFSFPFGVAFGNEAVFFSEVSFTRELNFIYKLNL